MEKSVMDALETSTATDKPPTQAPRLGLIKDHAHSDLFCLLIYGLISLLSWSLLLQYDFVVVITNITDNSLSFFDKMNVLMQQQ